MLKKIFRTIKAICLGYKTPKCTGIDLGSLTTKMVELKSNTLQIAQYSLSNIEGELISVTSGIVDVEKLSEHILKQWNTFKSKSENIAIAIPHDAVIIKEFEIPKISNMYTRYDYIKRLIVKDLEVDELDFDYTIKSNIGDNQIARVVVAKKEKIEEYQAVVQLTGLNTAAIEVDSFGVIDLLTRLVNKYQIVNQTVFIDIGSNSLKTYVFVNGSFEIYKDLSIEVNQLLVGVWLKIGSSDKVDYPSLFDYLLGNSQNSTIICDYMLEQFSILFNILKNNLLLENQISLSSNCRIYLFGGNSLIPSLRAKLNQQFNNNVYFIDELLPENKHIPQEILVRLIGAISLATWGNNAA